MYDSMQVKGAINWNLQEGSMKKLLLIVGIISLAACVLSLLLSALSWLGYYNLMDGSADLYSSLHRRMILWFVIGIVFAVIGTICMFIRFKK